MIELQLPKTDMSILEDQIKDIIYNQGLNKALDFAYDNVRFYRHQLIILKDKVSRVTYIENYKFLKHFIQEANRKDKWSITRRNHH